MRCYQVFSIESNAANAAQIVEIDSDGEPTALDETKHVIGSNPTRRKASRRSDAGLSVVRKIQKSGKKSMTLKTDLLIP